MKSSEQLAALEALLPEVLEAALEYVRQLPTREVRAGLTDEDLRGILDHGLPTSPSDPLDVLHQLLAASGGLVPSGAGKYFGYVVGGTVPVGVAADWLTSVWDQNCIVHDGSPLTAVLEDICGRWLTELFALPATTSYAFTPACTHADLLGLTVARHEMLARHGWDVAQQGLQGGPTVTVLVNETIHAAVTRPLQILGLGGSIRELPADSEGRILQPALEKELDKVRGGPLIVCGHVGEINTGGVDRLRPLAERTHAAGGWLHLDAAFGAWAAASPRLRHTLLDGLDLADSLATDTHKWLNAPYDCGVALIADARAHRAALPLSADYLNLRDNQR
ncbi:pyridoxal phosphate-dependent decarboxylase family protein, partial [Streptomyces sp. NPDC002784]